MNFYLKIGLFIFYVLVLIKLNTTFIIMYPNSDSMNLNTYLLVMGSEPKIGDVAVYRYSKKMDRYKHYDWFQGVKNGFTKRIVGKGGQTVCTIKRRVYIDNKPIGVVRRKDPFGKLLPINRGCRKIKKNYRYLLSDKRRLSFDSKYYGEISKDLIEGKGYELPEWIFRKRLYRF